MNKPAIQRCLEAFCKLVLVDDDTLEFGREARFFAESWIRAIKADPDSFLGIKKYGAKRIDLEELLQNIVHEYELGCTKCAPYSFYSSLSSFHTQLLNYWLERCSQVGMPAEYVSVPYELNYAYAFIQQRCGFFDAVKIYTNMRESNIYDQIERRIGDVTKVVKADVDEAKQEIDKKVAASADESSRKMAENSVTVLGIFSGIILTLAGVFSFSSVALENLNTSNFYRLLAVVSIIGMLFSAVFLGLFYFLYSVRYNIKLDMPDGEKKYIKHHENKLLIPIIIVEIAFVLIVGYLLGFHSEDLKTNMLENKTAVVESTTVPETQAIVTETTEDLASQTIAIIITE